MSDTDETQGQKESGPGLIQFFRVAPRPASAPPKPRRWRWRERSSVIAMSSYTLSKKGVARYDWADPYRLAVELTWPRFLAVLFSIYMSVTALFACLYTLSPVAVANARPYVFSDHFFFSLETLATVGYGYMYPATRYGHIIASVEILTGLTFSAILTGLTFVRFSKPRAKFLFAKHPVVTTHNGKPTLMLRVGNGQPSVLAEAKVKLSVLISEVSKEGSYFRRTHELALARTSVPVFPLSWTIMHTIDEHSPIYGLDAKTWVAADVRLFVSFEARDPALALVVHDLHDYAPGDVLFGMRYVDIIGTDENGLPSADMTKIDDVEPGPD